MGRSLVSLGANIGDSLATIRQAAEELRKQVGCRQGRFQIGRLFRTPPVGGPSGQPPFVNAVAAIESEIDPWELWAIVRRLEHLFGRERNLRWEARKIDLDILLCNDQRIWTPHLKVPHPRMCMRRFILVPAADVAAPWIDPVTGKTIGELRSALENGRANLVLVSSRPAAAQTLLEEVARLSVAEWLDLTADDTHVTSESTSSGLTRWVSFAPLDQLESASSLQATKLAVFLADPTPSNDVAWEDYHRLLARELNLLPDTTGLYPLPGPRYLLAGDQRDWAVHELVAALEAMDCPVEPIE